MGLHLSYWVHLWAVKVQETSTNWSKFNRRPPDWLGLEHLTCEKRLRDLGWFSLEERQLWRHLIAAFSYLKGSCRKGRAILFS